ncbi:acyltransferase family protein [Variovorax sp. HJSM1_2]|uniref:acyltransferase family protein n=1 Tax=Variovorax sp. HJSM1_2 TaxID=3366263 RepID=UPI003BD5ED26
MIKLDENISKRIAILRYLLIFGIIVLHTPPYVPLAETGPGFFNFIKALFQHAIFRASVPVLTFISGYLLFNSQLDLNFKKLIPKKIKSILIPLIIFNLPIAVAVYFIQMNQWMDHVFSINLYPFKLINWANAIVGLFTAPINFPLNFLRDLFLLSVIAPVFGFFLRKYIWHGLIIVFFLFFFDLDGQFFLRNTMPILFYIGGMASIQKWDMSKLDKYGPLLLAIFLALCISVVFFKIENRSYLRLVSPLLIWPAAAMLVNTRFGDWLAKLSKYSFFTFLAQGPLFLVAFFIYQKIFSGIPYWIFWILTPIILALILAQIYIYSNRFFPKTMRIVLGNR